MPVCKDPIKELHRCEKIRQKHLGRRFTEEHKANLRKVKRIRKYTYDTTFFDTWTPKMAYIFGFLLADAGIYRSTVSLQIQERDVELLKSIAEELKVTSPITRYKKLILHDGTEVTYPCLRIHCCDLVRKLTSMGCGPRRKLVMELPYVPDSVFSHFVRGFVDADGCVTKDGKVFIICGSEKFILEMQKKINFFINRTGYIQVRVKKPYTTKLYYLIYEAKIAVDFGNFIYQDKEQSLFLSRKFDRFCKYRDWQAEHGVPNGPGSRTYSDTVLLQALKASIDVLGHVPTDQEYFRYRKSNNVSCPSYLAIARRFGSWNKALEKLNV